MNRVLIIEEDLSIAKLETDILEKNQYQVTVKYNGLEGTAEALKGDYDLIILEIMLSELDGLSICREIREQIDIPILIVSVKGDLVDKIVGLSMGADDYIAKPFNNDELVARVRCHIHRYRRLTCSDHRREVIVNRDLRIDVASRRVYVVDKEIKLTLKEYDLLYYMAKRVGRICNKGELFQRVWGNSTYSDMGTLAVHVRGIRKKIEEYSSSHFIETIWGYGYRFVE